LPDFSATIDLVSMRELAWPAARLDRRHGSNLLAAEALGAAVETGVAIASAAPNLPPRLVAAAASERVRLITPPAL
jgi:hypothetical protein